MPRQNRAIAESADAAADRYALPVMDASPTPETVDQTWMRRALALAERGRERDDEVPIGAVVVLNGIAIGEGWNRNIGARDPTAHAEIVALRRAARRIGNHRIVGATLYVTLEPCPMCAMAMVHARVARLIYGASDPKIGAAGGMLDLLSHPGLNHRIDVTGGVLAADAAAMLRGYFAVKRTRANAIRDP